MAEGSTTEDLPPPVPPAALSPRQRETLARLGAAPGERPTFPDDLGPRLRAALEDDLAPTVAALPEGADLVLTKHALATVHNCEARWLADALDPTFTPSPPVVQGAVAHKAIELTLNRAKPASPAHLVDAALGRLAASDAWMAAWLNQCDEDEWAEVRGAATATVTAFTEVWPPLKRSWRPVTEQSLRAELAGGRVVLRGRIDLSLGTAEGNRAGKVIVDFKTGRFLPHHLDDLRFYALVETLRLGVPPRALASSYLDSGQLHVEPVTEGLLDAAAARAADGAARMVAVLHRGDEAHRRPSGACRWCPIRSDCEPGRAFLADPGDDNADADL